MSIERSLVEEYFASQPVFDASASERIRVVPVDNYAMLGQLTALRFLEWVVGNPEGVVALPTGRTPEYFIKWVQYYLSNWDAELNGGMLHKTGFTRLEAPSMKGLHFVQLDEFFPINPEHERSFSHFVHRFYLEGFGLDPEKALLIDTYHIKKEWRERVPDATNVEEIFPDGDIDLRLRTGQPSGDSEWRQFTTIKLFDQFCEEYEERIRALGGIGFFLGGIGPDGHIAFNVRGSSHHSDTRLTDINYETMAQAAADLGGIESVRKKAVITIGLETITYNEDCVAIIMAAGKAKSEVVANAIQNDPAIDAPASCLQRLDGARFYLTAGAAERLEARSWALLRDAAEASDGEIEELMIQGSRESMSLMQVANGLSPEEEPDEWELASTLRQKPTRVLTEETYERLIAKIDKGLDIPRNQRILHTAPHHDDIELAYFPLIHHLVRSPSHENYFCYCTSGFTAVTNEYILPRLENLRDDLHSGRLFRTLDRASLLEPGGGQRDVHGYLNGLASQNGDMQDFFVSCRLARLIGQEVASTSDGELLKFIDAQIAEVRHSSPGQIDSATIQRIKGGLREWEADLAWAHFGIGMDRVFHLRLEFYTGEIFPEDPDEKDVATLLELMEEIRPSVVTLTMDPEGSGPDTHYKTLIAIAKALELYIERHPGAPMRVWGYRNVWTRYRASEVNTIVPVSLNSFAVLHNMFNTCFSSQKSASFPSYELDGTFSQLAQKIWTEQLNDLTRVLGDEFLYNSTNPLLRRAYGAIYLRDLSFHEFQQELLPVKALLHAKERLRGS